MKLSEAIRLGAMATEPCHGPIFRRDAFGNICATCAIGAPVYALLADAAYETRAIDFIYSQWPWTRGAFQSPVGLISDDAARLMVDLFEFRGWSREQIADWVATIEPPEAEPVADPVRTPVAVEAQ